MIGLLHEDIWGVIVRNAGDSVTTALSRTCRLARTIVYGHYVDLIGPAAPEHRKFVYESYTCVVNKNHVHSEFDVTIYKTPGPDFSYDIQECDKCDDDLLIDNIRPMPPFSPAIVKIAAGLAEFATDWQIRL